MRRLTGDEHLGPEFATTWPTYDLDQKTRALLTYAKKLTEEPSMSEDADVEALREAGWDERGIYEATALISLFNYSGRMEAASGLPMDSPVHPLFTHPCLPSGAWASSSRTIRCSRSTSRLAFWWSSSALARSSSRRRLSSVSSRPSR